MLVPSTSALQKLLDQCHLFAHENEVTYNVTKTKVMCIKPNTLNNLYVPSFWLNDKVIKQVKEQVYLGVVITDDYRDDITIEREIKALYSRGNALLRKFAKCSEQVKIRLFQTYCCSFYCSSLWANIKKKQLLRDCMLHTTIFLSL